MGQRHSDDHPEVGENKTAVLVDEAPVAERRREGPWSRLTSAYLSRLSRITSTGVFVREIDGLRFFAVLAVIYRHANWALHTSRPAVYGPAPTFAFWDNFFECGTSGVSLFFAISGFVLALPFAKHYLLGSPRPQLRRYLLRRLTRLEPPYIINLLLCFFFRSALAVGAVGLLPHLLVSLTYTHNLLYGQASLVNGVAWSLEIEVQFYLLAPLLAKLYMIRRTATRRLVIVAIAAAFAAVQHYVPGGGWFVRYFGLSIVYKMQYFLVGFLLVDVFILNWNEKPRQGRLWDVVATASWLCLVFVLRYNFFTCYLLPALILFAYIGAFRGNTWNRIVCNRWLVTIGGMCYTIYLYHNRIVQYLIKALLHLPLTGKIAIDVPLVMLVVLPVVVLTCSAFFLLFEKPFMQRDWPQKWAQALRSKFGRSE